MKCFPLRQLQYRVAAALLICGAFARADEGWTLTTTDFKTTTVNLTAIDATALTVEDNAGSHAVSLSSIIQLSRGTNDDAVKGLVLCVADGERLVGTPKKLDGSSLLWFTSGAGDISVPIEQTLGVLRDRVDLPGLSADRTEDTVKLATGDTVHGIVTDVSDKTFTLTPATGDPASVPVDSVASLLFASPPGGRMPGPSPAYKIHLNGGSVIAFKSIALQADQLTGERAAGGSLNIPLAQITSIENTAGPVQWLSSRTPIESSYTPFLAGHFLPRMDRSVTGGPIRFHGTRFARGIGMHSRTKMVFAVEPGDRSLRTQYAIDGDLPDADVDVRILVDDKVVHECKGFRAGVLSPVVEIDLDHAKTVTLEVDYGQGYDVQDRLNWIEPAVLRSTP